MLSRTFFDGQPLETDLPRPCKHHGYVKRYAIGSKNHRFGECSGCLVAKVERQKKTGKRAIYLANCDLHRANKASAENVSAVSKL